jgi:endonuclease/exonuclease/phosphatase family metal-dependent hydrolase
MSIGPEYTILSFNLMRDERCEDSAYPHLHWSQRQPMVLETIHQTNPDIIGFQEANDLPNAPFSEFKNQLNAIGYVGMNHEYIKHPKLRVATFWKYNKFRNLGSNTFWLKQPPNHGNGLPRPMGFDYLVPISSNPAVMGRALRVYNTHFGHTTLEKEHNVMDVLRIMKQNAGTPVDNPSLLMLDGNFFNQSGGLQLRMALCNFHNTWYQLNDLTYYARLWSSKSQLYTDTSNNGPQVYGTFVSSSIDKYQLPEGVVLGDSLDCIAGHGIRLHNSYVVDIIPVTSNWMRRNEMKNALNLPINVDIYPSDHLALYVTISW